MSNRIDQALAAERRREMMEARTAPSDTDYLRGYRDILKRHLGERVVMPRLQTEGYQHGARAATRHFRGVPVGQRKALAGRLMAGLLKTAEVV